MHIHILGICGTFMGGVAALARAEGHTVTGSDAGVYPPMSTQLEALGIEISEGFEAEHLQPAPDMVVVGNVVSRGNAAMEYVLNAGLPYTSGPAWLSEHVLNGQHVLAVAGTHGKTTTSSMLAYILDQAGLNPGFLIGGVTKDFDTTARAGAGRYFVVEADEYDTAFFDKRSKFVHYHPRTLVLNNLEFDHADIFDDLAAIERQFHHLVRTVPGEGRILADTNSEALQRVLEMGCWSETQALGSASGWQARPLADDSSAFTVSLAGETLTEVRWNLIGPHNLANGLAAIAAANHVGVSPAQAASALGQFAGVKRRLELRGTVNGIEVYDDFAHHPTAIASTLAGMKATDGRVLAVLEPRSNTMKMGVHREELKAALATADAVFVYTGGELDWQPAASEFRDDAVLQADIDQLVAAIVTTAQPGDRVLVMSNGGFGGIHEKLLTQLADADA